MNEKGKPFKFQRATTNSNNVNLSNSNESIPKKAIETALLGNVERFQELVQKYPDVINMKEEKHGNVALHVASSKNNVALMEYLIRKGANINIQDIWGNTPLLYAVDKQCVQAVKVLLEHGAKVNMPDFRGNTALHTSCKHGHVEITKLLLKFGADPDILDYNNIKPVQRARNYEVVELIEMEVHRRENRNTNAQQVVNYLGLGLGLGIGIGLSFAKQQHMYSEQKRLEDERIRLEEERTAIIKRNHRQSVLRKQSMQSIQQYLKSADKK